MEKKTKKKKTFSKIFRNEARMRKIFRILTVVLFWAALVGIGYLIYRAIENSFGNMAEMIKLLDSKKYTATELQEHYNMLIEKYGEWHIGSGSTGFQLNFINVKKVFFSGLMIADLIGSGMCLVAAIFAKKILPKLSNELERDSQDKANYKMLEMLENITENKENK